jgi:hypothetical protein
MCKWLALFRDKYKAQAPNQEPFGKLFTYPHFRRAGFVYNWQKMVLKALSLFTWFGPGLVKCSLKK